MAEIDQEPVYHYNDTSRLAAALAKAQAAFPPIPRDKRVTVQTLKGGSYTFNYAPLDSILAAVRDPLSKNGLAIAQLLDGDDLVTLLLHDSGGRLEGRMPLPPRKEGDTVQALGSAITYLRRYAIQAVLGIAAEEDDDGNASAGNKVRDRKHPGLVDGDPPEEDNTDGSLIGTVAKGKPPVDLELRETPDGPITGFKLTQGRGGLQVVASGSLATSLYPLLAGLEGKRVTVWGTVVMVPWAKDGKDMPPYRRLELAKIDAGDWVLPTLEVESLPMFTDAEAAAIIEAEKLEAASS